MGNQILDRFDLLRRLKELGYETGSGIMIGIPGQTYAAPAKESDLFCRYDMDIVGVGPYIPN